MGSSYISHYTYEIGCEWFCYKTNDFVCVISKPSVFDVRVYTENSILPKEKSKNKIWLINTNEIFFIDDWLVVSTFNRRKNNLLGVLATTYYLLITTHFDSYAQIISVIRANI